MDSGPGTVEGALTIGNLLRGLHEATTSFRPEPDATWPLWFGRDVGGPGRVIGHCDVAAWNVVTRNGIPVAPLVELAQACWLNANLHGDDVAEREGLPPLADRARQLRAFVDAYGLSAKQRRGFVDRIIEYVAHDTAEQANAFGVTPEFTDPTPDGFPLVWGLAVGDVLSAPLEGIIENHVDQSAPILIEGDGILPSLLSRPHVVERAAFIRAVFIVEPDEAAALENILERGRAAAGRTQEELENEARARWLFGQWIVLEAARYDMPVFEPRPWETLAERLIYNVA